jgi:hypothetical protein
MMRRFLRQNGLSLVLLVSFFLLLVGQSWVGLAQYNEERRERRLPPLNYPAYLASSHFWEATTENWESEFFQMSIYVLLTAYLFQRGSSESKSLEGENPQDEDPRRHRRDPDAPWPVRRGGWVLRLYEYSLSLAFVTLFLLSVALHGWSGCRLYNEEQTALGEPPIGFLEYLGTSRFWFESLQNWQSEFLAVASIVLLSIFLRHRGSPESKPVAAPHWQTGE